MEIDRLGESSLSRIGWGAHYKPTRLGGEYKPNKLGGINERGIGWVGKYTTEK